MHVCATLGSIGTRLQEIFFVKYLKKKSHKVVIFHVCTGCPYPTDCNGSLHYVQVTNAISHAVFGGCMLRCFVSAKGQI
jgi:hypothetical protein